MLAGHWQVLREETLAQRADPAGGLLPRRLPPSHRRQSCVGFGNGKPFGPRVGREWPLAGMLAVLAAKESSKRDNDLTIL
jgi:hypothetical protein